MICRADTAEALRDFHRSALPGENATAWSHSLCDQQLLLEPLPHARPSQFFGRKTSCHSHRTTASPYFIPPACLSADSIISCIFAFPFISIINIDAHHPSSSTLATPI